MVSEFQRNRKAKIGRKGGADFLWFLAFFLIPLVPWWIVTDVMIPDFWDTQYVMKINGLKACIATAPQHPLWVVMGSSRVEYGFCPRVMEDRMKPQGAPFIYNFGMGGADLFRQYIALRRMISDGIKPARVGIELMGAALGSPTSPAIENNSLAVRARSDELADYVKYSSVPGETRIAWYQSRFRPTFEYGTEVPAQALYLRWPALPIVRKMGTPPPFDRWGWHITMPYQKHPATEQSRIEEIARNTYIPMIKEDFEITTLQRDMARRILELCRSEKISVFLIRMPESGRFQEIYTPRANAAIDSWISDLVTANNIPFIDARNWIETKGFYDGHHMNGDGAEKFSSILGDVLFPAVKR